MGSTPTFSNNQFVDAPALNTAFGTVAASIANATSGVFPSPGLLYPETVPAFTVSGLSVTGVFAPPFGLVTPNGTVVRAHGVTTNADTQTYVLDFTPLVPLTGTVSAYVAISASTIQQSPIGIPGPPPGFPTYNPNFVPTVGYQSLTDTLSVTATTGVPDNVNSFFFASAALTAGQTSLTTGAFAASLGRQIRASHYSAETTHAVTGSTVLPGNAISQTILALASGSIVLTLPPAAAAIDQPIKFVCANQTPGATLTLAVAGAPDVITGLNGLFSASSIVMPVGATVTLTSRGTAYFAEAASLSMFPAPAGLLNVQTFSTPGAGTYTPTSGMAFFVGEVWGGGGGGVGGGGGAGNAGGYAMGFFAASALTTRTYTIGSGGLGYPGSSGIASTGGGTTIFDVLLSATGGSGIAWNGVPSAGGMGYSGMVNLRGAVGQDIGGAGLTNAPGASAPLGGGGGSPIAGGQQASFGAGGGASSATVIPDYGGNGGAGFLRVWEFGTNIVNGGGGGATTYDPSVFQLVGSELTLATTVTTSSEIVQTGSNGLVVGSGGLALDGGGVKLAGSYGTSGQVLTSTGPSGATWAAAGGFNYGGLFIPVTISRPASGAFTLTNSTATGFVVDNINGPLTLLATAVSGGVDCLSTLTQSTPSTGAWTATARLNFGQWPIAGYTGAGICVVDSAGKYKTFGLLGSNTAATQTANLPATLFVQSRTTATTPSTAASAIMPWLFSGAEQWLRIVNDTTNLYFQTSVNGASGTWTTFYKETVSNFLNGTLVSAGLFIHPQDYYNLTSGALLGMDVLGWQLTSGAPTYTTWINN